MDRPCQMRLICYCLPATDRVIYIKFMRSCFRLTLPLLNRKAFHVFHLINSSSGALEFIIIWLKQYARSDWLLSGHYFLVMTGHYEIFSRPDGSFEL